MTILKGIPRILPPRLLYILASMGHGDELVLADANFPSASVARAGETGSELVCCDSLTVPELLQAICQPRRAQVFSHLPHRCRPLVQDSRKGMCPQPAFQSEGALGHRQTMSHQHGLG